MTNEELTKNVSALVLAAAPLSASQVAAAYRIDKATILTACKTFTQSAGARGLSHFKLGSTIRIRPAAVEEWMKQLEQATAKCEII